jgi:hypothetical protein
MHVVAPLVILAIMAVSWRLADSELPRGEKILRLRVQTAGA